LKKNIKPRRGFINSRRDFINSRRDFINSRRDFNFTSALATLYLGTRDTLPRHSAYFISALSILYLVLSVYLTVRRPIIIICVICGICVTNFVSTKIFLAFSLSFQKKFVLLPCRLPSRRQTLLEIEALCFYLVSRNLRNFNVRQDGVTMVHAVWRGSVISISFLPGFLRTST